MAYCSAVAAVATATNINISSPGGSSNFDGVTLASGTSRVLLTGQTTTASQNGVWIWNGSASALTRPVAAGDPFATGATLDYAIVVPVAAGGATWGGSKWWMSSPTSGTSKVDTDNLTFIRQNIQPVQARVASSTDVMLSGPGLLIDGRTVTDGAITTGASSTTLTCSTSQPFISADMGKTIVVNGAGVAGANLMTTIAGVTSASAVALTVGCSTSITTTVTDGAMTTGGSATTLTCSTSHPFVSTDAGKRIVVAGAGAGGANLVTTILGYTSSSVVALTAGCSTSVTGATVQYGFTTAQWGVTLNAGDVVLLAGQTSGNGAKDNGLYFWNGASSAMTRTADPIYPAMEVQVSEGASLAHADYKLGNQGTVVVGSSGSALNFARQNVYNVQDFGAAPSASAATNATAFVAAITAAKAAGGGIIRINPGTFAMTPNSIVINGDSIILQGSGLVGTTLAMTAAGTAIKVDVKSAGVNVQGCGVNDLIVSFVGVTGAGAIGLDMSGGQYCHYNRILMRMPLGAQSYAFYLKATTTAGPYWNQVNDSTAWGSAFAGDTTNYGSVAVYIPYNSGTGGANSNSFKGLQASGWNYAIWVEYGSGNNFYDVDSEYCTLAHVRFGSATGLSAGTHVHFKYLEQYATCYVARFEVNANQTLLNTGNLVEISYWNNLNPGTSCPAVGLTIPGLIDATNSPLLGNNIVEVLGAKHGAMSLYYQGSNNAANIGHYNTSDRSVFLPDLSGDVALKAPGQAASGGASLAALTADFNALLSKLRTTGVIDSYSPQTDGAVCWLRADSGLVRSGTPSTWTDIIGGVVFSCHAMTYVDNGAGPHSRPQLSFNAGSSYATGTLASTVTACSIFVVAQIKDGATGSDALVEITPAGTINTGVSMFRDTGTEYVRRLASSATTSYTIAGTGWALFEGVFANASGNGYINDGSNFTDASAQTLVASGLVCIGALGNGAADFLNGRIAEVIIFPTAVSSGVRANVHSYMQTRYGTP